MKKITPTQTIVRKNIRFIDKLQKRTYLNINNFVRFAKNILTTTTVVAATTKAAIAFFFGAGKGLAIHFSLMLYIESQKKKT